MNNYLDWVDMEANSSLDIFIKTCTLLIASLAFIISIFLYKRNRRLNNEDQIFKDKLQSYQHLTRLTFEFLEESYSLLDLMADFKGVKEEWENNEIVTLPKLEHV